MQCSALIVISALQKQKKKQKDPFKFSAGRLEESFDRKLGNSFGRGGGGGRLQWMGSVLVCRVDLPGPLARVAQSGIQSVPVPLVLPQCT